MVVENFISIVDIVNILNYLRDFIDILNYISSSRNGSSRVLWRPLDKHAAEKKL